MEEEVEKQKYSSHPQAKKVEVHKHHSMISSLSKETKYGLLEQCDLDAFSLQKEKIKKQ